MDTALRIMLEYVVASLTHENFAFTVKVNTSWDVYHFQYEGKKATIAFCMSDDNEVIFGLLEKGHLTETECLDKLQQGGSSGS